MSCKELGAFSEEVFIVFCCSICRISRFSELFALLASMKTRFWETFTHSITNNLMLQSSLTRALASETAINAF